MKPGTALTVFIPSPLGYGKFGSPPVIMPDAILMFDMELISIQKQQ
jgi:FKBP-type peptidyl-prolyl cis-trans isomerase